VLLGFPYVTTYSFQFPRIVSFFKLALFDWEEDFMITKFEL